MELDEAVEEEFCEYWEYKEAFEVVVVVEIDVVDSVLDRGAGTFGMDAGMLLGGASCDIWDDACEYAVDVDVALAFENVLDLGKADFVLTSGLMLEPEFEEFEETRDNFGTVSGDFTSVSRLSLRRRTMPKGGLAIDDV